MMAIRPRQSLAADDSGQILIMTALMLPVLLGFMALALDAGYAFDYRKRVQTAADSAALAGAYAREHNTGATVSTVETIARADATRNGFTHGVNGVTVSVFACSPITGTGTTCPRPANGFELDYTGDTTAVGVIIQQPKSLFFIQVLNSALASMSIGGKAVANRGATSDLNIVVLHPTDYNSLHAQGNGNIQVAGSVYVNSCAGGAGCAPTGSGSAAAEAVGGSSAVNASGHIFVTGSVSGAVAPVTTGTPPLTDPLLGLPIPSVPGIVGSCAAGICTPGRYPTGMDLGAGTWTLQSGLYYIETGGLSFHHGANVTGTGVTIYNSAGQFEIDQAATTVSLTAPSSGTYRAVVYFQNRENHDTFSVKQGTIAMNGLIYMRNAGLEFVAGGTTPTGTTLHAVFVVSTLRLHGGGLIADFDFSGFGGSPIQRVSIVE